MCTDNEINETMKRRQQGRKIKVYCTEVDCKEEEEEEEEEWIREDTRDRGREGERGIPIRNREREHG